MQQLDNDDEGEDDDDDRNDSEEAIDAGLVGAPVASTCKQRSSEPKPTILFCSVPKRVLIIITNWIFNVNRILLVSIFYNEVAKLL